MTNLKKIIGNKALIITILTIAFPAIIEMGMNTLLGLADTIMISQFIGKQALIAVGYANQIMYTLIFIFSAFNTGATALISRAFGEKDFKKLNDVAGQNIIINMIIGLVITVASFFYAEQLFSIFELSTEVKKLALDYYYSILIGMLPMFFSFSCAGILRGAGNTKTPMMITAIANVANIIGNYVLITGFGPFPELGVVGAGLSTALSRIFVLVMYMYYFKVKSDKIKINFKKLRLSKAVLKPLWSLSYPGAIEQGLMQISFLVIGILVSKLNEDSQAAFRLLVQIESISFMPAVGLSIAAAALVGKALGEKDVEKSLNTGYSSFLMSIIWGIFIGIVFYIFSSPILSIFTKDDALIKASIPVMTFLGLTQPFLNLLIVLGGALRGAGDTKTVMYFTLLRLWIINLPLAWLFIIMMGTGVEGIWYAEMITFVIVDLAMFIRFYRRKWTKIKVKVEY